MNIIGIFNILSIIAWLLILLFLTLGFIRTARERSWTAALRGLLTWRTLGLLSIPLLFTLLAAAIVFVRPQETAVVVSYLQPNGYRPAPLTSGVHMIVPLAEQAVRYPIYWQTYTMSGRPTEGAVTGNDAIVARTIDGQQVIIDCSVIFRVDREQAVNIYIDWQDRYIEELVRPRTRGLVRSQVARYTVDEVNSFQRTNLERDLDTELRAILEAEGFELNAFVLRNISFSPEYTAAVEEKQVALQQQERAEFQAQQIRNIAEGEADAVEIRARAEAAAVRVRAQAEADARVIRAQAEREALQLINEAIAQNPQLLTYEYIARLSPSIRTLLVPSNAPLVLPLGGEQLFGETVPLTPTAPLTTPNLLDTSLLTGQSP